MDTFWTGSIKDKSLFSDPRYAAFRDPDNFKMPCWLLPPREYRGAYWFQRRVGLDEAGLWMELILARDGETLLSPRESFGFVRIGTRSREILLNGQPVKLRGTFDCAVFPMHGYPPTDVPSWERILRQIRNYGLHHVRSGRRSWPETAWGLCSRSSADPGGRWAPAHRLIPGSMRRANASSGNTEIIPVFA